MATNSYWIWMMTGGLAIIVLCFFRITVSNKVDNPYDLTWSNLWKGITGSWILEMFFIIGILLLILGFVLSLIH